MRALFFLFIFATTQLAAQQHPLATVSFDSLEHLTVDRAGDFYAVALRTITKFDGNGKSLYTFTAADTVTWFDPGNGVRQVAFLRGQRRCLILSPTLQEVSRIDLGAAIAIEPWLACASGDVNLLVLDRADQSIKRVDLRSGAVKDDFTLSLSSENITFVALREYQHYIFLLTSNGEILMFNNFGRLVKTFPGKGVRSFHFFGQELYFIDGEKLVRTDLFSGDTTEHPIPATFRRMVFNDTRKAVSDGRALYFFEFTP